MHTKGPWDVLVSGTDELQICAFEPYVPVSIATVHDVEDEGDIRANAALLAAAPELLAALEAVMGGQLGGSIDLDAERFLNARMAIAKAKDVEKAAKV